MSSATANLKIHLEPILGAGVELQLIEGKRLPLFLSNRFSFYRTELLGRRWTLAVEDESWDTGSAGEYEKQAELLRAFFDDPILFVFEEIPSNTRNRMVQNGTPFIVPGTQIFLPGALVDLRERFPKPNQKGRVSLTPIAQLAVLYHLQREPLTGLPLKDIAQKLHCSAMMLSNVKDELEEAEICKVERIGRTMALRFPDSNRDLWDRAEKRLCSPVKKTRWARWTREPGYPALLSGITALSRRTMLNDDRLPTYAFGPRMLESYLEQGILIGCRDSDEATAKMETWSYEPKLLGDNEAVDPLSLYLSLRFSADERVAQQLEKLLSGIAW